MPTPSTADFLQRQLADPAGRQRLIAAYVRGTMPPEQVDVFELRLFDAPDLAAEVEAEEYLRETYQSMKESDAVPLLAPQRRDRRVPLALAAGLLAGALVPSLLWWQSAERQMLATVPMAEPAAVYALSAARGTAATAPVQRVPLSAPRVALQIPAPNEDGPYRVRLLGSEGGKLLAEAVVPTEIEGYVGLSLDAASLRGTEKAQIAVDVRRGADWTLSGTYPLIFVVDPTRR